MVTFQLTHVFQLRIRKLKRLIKLRCPVPQAMVVVYLVAVVWLVRRQVIKVTCHNMSGKHKP